MHKLHLWSSCFHNSTQTDRKTRFFGVAGIGYNFSIQWPIHPNSTSKACVPYRNSKTELIKEVSLRLWPRPSLKEFPFSKSTVSCDSTSCHTTAFLILRDVQLEGDPPLECLASGGPFYRKGNLSHPGVIWVEAVWNTTVLWYLWYHKPYCNRTYRVWYHTRAG